MSYFAVTREAGTGWAADTGAFDQPGVGDHVAFMNALADDRFVLFAGPLAGSEQGRIRVLLIADAADEAAITARLADDPWVSTGQLVTTSIESWSLIVGGDRLSTTPPTP
jgi:uncharacterized protein YciI